MISQERLLKKISSLPSRRIAEVEDFVDFLSSKESEHIRSERAKRIAEFAREYAGTAYDLDPELEAAGIESLLKIDEDENQ